MRELEFIVPVEYDRIRLKNFLRSFCHVSARLLIRLKREPLGITRNGLHTIVTETLHTADVIRLRMPEDEKQPFAVDLPFSVVYEDEDLLIADKPSNMPMYPTPGHDSDSLANAAAAYFAKNDVKIAFRPVYRLDKDTTGLVLLAKNSYSAACLAGCVGKEYTAVCEGILTGSGVIDQPIGLKEGHRIQRAVTPLGEKAVTQWRTVGTGCGHSQLVLQLLTGRTHQIRVHLSHSGHPLAGDDLYGGSLEFIQRQALHCGKIWFIHPYTKTKLEFSSDYPPDMEQLFVKCNMETVQKSCTESEKANINV